jgi:hypothetical protein
VSQLRRAKCEAEIKLKHTYNCSYQACESLYLENGFNSEQASTYMRGAVGIAQEAITKTGKAGGSKVGLCLGPFGGTLSPGQE